MPPDAETVGVAVAVATRGGRVLVARRSPDAHLPGLWEFPGGKLRQGEEPETAARRELEEETGLAAGAAEPLVVHVYPYPDRRICLYAYLVREPAGEVSVGGGREWAWVAPEDLERLEMPPANAPVLRALRWRLGP